MRISGRQMEKRQNGQIRQKYFECCRTKQKLVCSQPKRRQKKRKILLWKNEGRNRSNCKIYSTIATSNVKICSDEFIGSDTLFATIGSGLKPSCECESECEPSCKTVARPDSYEVEDITLDLILDFICVGFTV